MATEEELKKQKIEEEEEIEIVETLIENEDHSNKDKDKDDIEDDRLRITDDDEDDDPNNKEGETPEQRTERRREERRKRKARQKQAELDSRNLIASQKHQIDEMASRLASIENYSLNNEARSVDQRMDEARRRYEFAEASLAEAVAKGDGKGVSLAMRARDEASANYNDALSAKNRISSIQPQARREEPKKPKLADPKTAEMAKDFLSRHDWIDPRSETDEDSIIARAIDQMVAKEGYDPRTQDYWDELQARLQKKLPHRFDAGKKDVRKSPPVNTGSDRSSSGKKQFYLSRERKEAMQLDGSWDNLEKRNKMIRAYMKYDKENPPKK